MLQQEHNPSSASRDRVLHAAYGLFVQAGFPAVSMQQIADEAGITKATLYHHFRDKRDLYLAVMQLALENIQADVFQRLNQSTDLRGVVKELLSYLIGSGPGDLSRLAADLKLHFSTDAQHEFWMQFHPPWEIIRDPVQLAIDRGELTSQDAMFVARYIYGSASGISHLHRYEHTHQQVSEDLIEELTDAILLGITRR